MLPHFGVYGQPIQPTPIVNSTFDNEVKEQIRK